MTLKLAIWDLDGTIVDSRKIIQRAMEIAFESVDLAPPDYDATRKIVGLRLDTAISELAPTQTAERLQQMTLNYQNAFVKLRNDPDTPEPLYAGAVEVLQQLIEDGWLMGVATGKSRRGVTKLFEKHDLAQYFDAHYCADDGPGKPHPHMIECNLNHLGCEPENTVMIGDATFDMVMARNAKVHALGVSWGFGATDEIMGAGAHEVHHDFGSLKSALDSFRLSGAV